MVQYPAGFMPGTLFLVATPIGNLEDITLRALRTLREVGLIAAEDTRRTGQLLGHYRIPTPTTSFNEQNEARKLPLVLDRLRETDVALVSDAGTPGLSDPGFKLIRQAIAAGHRVEAVPGPSAVLAALVSSGLPFGEFTFVGFPPRKTAARRDWLRALATEPRTIVFFEAPHRILTTLSDAIELWGDRLVAVGRELTKIHEEFVRGPISSVIGGLVSLKGEFTVVVGPPETHKTSVGCPTNEQLATEFGHMTKCSKVPRRRIISDIARRHGLRSRQVYAAIMKSGK